MSSQFRAAVAEVVNAVAPLTVAVAVLSTVFLGLSWTTLAQLLIGAVFTTAGLFLFLRGTRIALLPMGEMIGAYLPRHGSTALLVATAFIFSFSVTIADPSVHVLVAQVGSFPDSGINPQVLAILLSGGMGLLVTIAILRILLDIPIKWLFAGAYSSDCALVIHKPRVGAALPRLGQRLDRAHGRAVHHRARAGHSVRASAKTDPGR